MISHNVVDLLVRHHQVSTLIPAPSISSSISTKPVELLVALRILSASSNKNRKRLKLSCNFYLQMCSAPPSVHRTKIHGDKGCHSPSITIKQWNQHAVPNRYPKHNQAKMTIHYSFRHVYVLTGIAKMHVASLSLYIYIYEHSTFHIYESNMWPYLTTWKRLKKHNITKERLQK